MGWTDRSSLAGTYGFFLTILQGFRRAGRNGLFFIEKIRSWESEENWRVTPEYRNHPPCKTMQDSQAIILVQEHAEQSNIRNWIFYGIKIFIMVLFPFVGLLGAILLPDLWEPISGRDFSPQVFMAGFLQVPLVLLFLGLGFANVRQTAIALAIDEIILAGTIVHFLSYPISKVINDPSYVFDAFFFSQFMEFNLFLLVPWLLSIGIYKILQVFLKRYNLFR
jgi:hypothetical protein